MSLTDLANLSIPMMEELNKLYKRLVSINFIQVRISPYFF